MRMKAKTYGIKFLVVNHFQLKILVANHLQLKNFIPYVLAFILILKSI